MEYLDITKVDDRFIYLSNKDYIFFTRGNWWAYHNRSKYTERIIGDTLDQALESYQDRNKVAIVNTDILKGVLS
jgi:hypothetical protein